MLLKVIKSFYMERFLALSTNIVLTWDKCFSLIGLVMYRKIFNCLNVLNSFVWVGSWPYTQSIRLAVDKRSSLIGLVMFTKKIQLSQCYETLLYGWVHAWLYPLSIRLAVNKHSSLRESALKRKICKVGTWSIGFW
jgi:hypothetical protein